MRTYPEQLQQKLNQGLHRSYLICGDEPLLKLESQQAIIQAAKAQGFLERHAFTLDASLDWQQVYDCANALSLFAQRQIIELQIGDKGIGKHSQALIELCHMLHDDLILIVSGERLNKQQENSKWAKAIMAQGLFVPCLTPDSQRLPRFVQQRCQQVGFKADTASIQLLCQWHEGNLLALSQSLEKLSLLYPDGLLTLPRLEEALSRHHHYTPFQLVDSLLAGQGKRSLRILEQLEAEGVELTILLRTLQKELAQLITLSQAMAQGEAMNQSFNRLQIWQNKRPLYQQALSRFSPSIGAKLGTNWPCLKFKSNKILMANIGPC